MLQIGAVTVPVDASEALEALAELLAWRARAAELPAHLRATLDELSARKPSELCDIQTGREVVASLKPEVRALLANLRALSPVSPAEVSP